MVCVQFGKADRAKDKALMSPGEAPKVAPLKAGCCIVYPDLSILPAGALAEVI